MFKINNFELTQTNSTFKHHEHFLERCKGFLKFESEVKYIGSLTINFKCGDLFHFSDEKMDFLTKLIKPQVKEEKPTDMLFDVSEFKANKNQKLSHEARRILTVLPQYRTDSDVHYVSTEGI